MKLYTFIFTLQRDKHPQILQWSLLNGKM